MFVCPQCLRIRRGPTDLCHHKGPAVKLNDPDLELAPVPWDEDWTRVFVLNPAVHPYDAALYGFSGTRTAVRVRSDGTATCRSCGTGCAHAEAVRTYLADLADQEGEAA